MENIKVYYITDGNEIADVLIGENRSQQAKITADLLNKNNERWINYNIIEHEAEGEIHLGYTNTITTITMNNEPVKTIINSLSKARDIVNQYIKLSDEYRRYGFIVNHIKL